MASSLAFSLSNNLSSPSSDPYLSQRITLPGHPQTLAFSTNITSPSKKNSLAVLTGKLLVRIALRLLKSRNRGFSDDHGSTTVLEKPRKKTNKNVNRCGVSNMRYNEERNGAVTEDKMEDEKERRVAASHGFSFSAAGLLFPYHLGVAQLLIEKGYIKKTTPLAGSSAGSIVCAVIASGATMEEALNATKVLAEDCRLKGTIFRLGAVLRDFLEKNLPDDVHTRSNGRIRVAVTQIFQNPSSLLVDQFDSKEDLINAVLASSFIPGYLAPLPATMFRNRLCVDGGLTLLVPPTYAAKTIGVCAFPTSGMELEGIGISPDCNPENRATGEQLFNWALEPADDQILDRLFEQGYQDAAVWAEENPIENLVSDDIPFLENGSASANVVH